MPTEARGWRGSSKARGAEGGRQKEGRLQTGRTGIVKPHGKKEHGAMEAQKEIGKNGERGEGSKGGA